LLLNLGYFRYGGTFNLLNWLAKLRPAQERLTRRAIDLLEVVNEDEVLDIACGRGLSSYMIRQLTRPRRTVGIDLLPENIGVAQTLYGWSDALQYHVGDAMRLDLPDRRFDKVLCLEAAFHFSDRAAFLRECGRVLRTGGRLAVVDFVWRNALERQSYDPEKIRLVREVWQWSDLYNLEDYRREAQRASLRLQATQDWTSHVTEPLLALFGHAAWLGARPWGRRLLGRYLPGVRNLNDEDWRQVQASADAHHELGRHVRYVAMVFESEA
jgi:ubiquinone/menaquinone biosynthesis C-methylase UbiE